MDFSDWKLISSHDPVNAPKQMMTKKKKWNSEWIVFLNTSLCTRGRCADEDPDGNRKEHRNFDIRSTPVPFGQ